MPELPEVETVKRTLNGQIIGLTIEKVVVNHEKMIKNPSVPAFMKQLIGQQFIDVKRRGKYLIFELDDYYLLSHLRMEGKFFYGNDPLVKDKHIHVTFELSSGKPLIYEDVRKFGTFHLYEKSIDLERTPSFAKLGPEPWADTFNVEATYNMLKGRKMPIKSMLLTQKVVAGLGNIYVDEVLFHANIHPLKKSGDLSLDEIDRVIFHTKEILKKAIVLKGTTIRTFSSSHGSTGEFQNFLQVHTRKDAPCHVCQMTIVKIKVGGRGTYFCPVCQPTDVN